MTRARNSAGQAAPVPTPSGDEGPPQFTRIELEAIYLVLRESYAPSARYEAQKSAVKKLRTPARIRDAMSEPVMVYVVMGSSGEYSDRREWGVCAYRTKKDADHHAFEATKRAKTIVDASRDAEDSWEACNEKTVRAAMGDLDPDAMSMDYTGSDYFVLAVPLREKTP